MTPPKTHPECTNPDCHNVDRGGACGLCSEYMTTTPPNTKEEAINITIDKLIDEILDHQVNTDCGDIECVLTGDPAKSFLQELWDQAYREGYSDGLDFGIKVKKWNPQPTAK